MNIRKASGPLADRFNEVSALRGQYGARPSSSRRRGLRNYLYVMQGGVCVRCGESMSWDGHASNRAVCAHLVNACQTGPSGSDGKNWVAGNITAQCESCNTSDRRANPSGDVTPDMLARPDLVVMEWPRGIESDYSTTSGWVH